MEVYYQVPTDAANGNFSGKEVMLDYGGSGNLWGFPGSCFNPSTGSFSNSCGSYGSWLPWVNRFEIPFDEDTGFQSGHVSSYKEGEWKNILTNIEQNEIKKEFGHWFKENNFNV